MDRVFVEPHRSISPSSALILAVRAASQIKCDLRVQTLAEVAGFKVTQAQLVREGRIVSTGAGKGFAEQADASAAYEALEHYYMRAETNAAIADDTCSSLTLYDVASQSSLLHSAHVQRMAKEYPAARVRCLVLQHETEALYWPAFLSIVDWKATMSGADHVAQFQSYTRYTSNSGFAAGASAEESIEHGICELLERDANSAMLIDAILGRRPQKAVAVDEPHLKTLVFGISGIDGTPPIILDTRQSAEDVPSYFAFVPPTLRSRVPHSGSGASPYPAYALTRALAELLQVAILTRVIHPTMPPRPVDLRSPWRELTLLDGIKLAESSLFSGCYQDCRARSTRSPSGDLERQGLKAFSRSFTPKPSSIDVTLTVVPGLEALELVTHGIPMLPTGRGVHAWRQYIRRGGGNGHAERAI